MNFNLLQIPVRIHPGFWFIAILLGIRNIHSSVDWTLPVWVGCLFVSIMVHEYGHALSARRFGARGLRVVLHAFGGLAASEGGLSRKQRIIELLCGPGAGFVLGAMALVPYLCHEYGVFKMDIKLYYTVWTLMFINLAWGLMNLLPIYPLDGGQITAELLSAKRPHGGLALAFRVSMYVSIACALIALVYSFICMYRKDPPQWFVVILFAILAYQNHLLGKSDYLHAAEEQRRQDSRQPWEQDPDWWKR